MPAVEHDGSKRGDTPAKREDHASDPKPDTKPAPKDGDGKQAKSKKSLGDDLDNLGKPKEKAEESPSDDADFDRPETPKGLRDAYKKTKAELDTYRKKATEYEQLVTRTKQETEEALKKDWEPRLAESEKRRSELETELRFLDYARSEDFKAKFHTPWEEGWKTALSEFEGLKVTTSDGQERDFHPSDLHALLGMPNFRAREIANAMFGTAAPDIMRHRAELMKLTGAKEKALQEWKQRGSERDAKLAEERKMTVKRWSDGIDEFSGEYPELFGEKDGDQEGNTLLRNGKTLARLAFLGEGLPDGLTAEQRRDTMLDAQTKIAVRGMAYGRVYRDLKSAEAKIAELEEKLKGYEGSEPGQGSEGRDHGASGGSERTPEDEIDAIKGTHY